MNYHVDGILQDARKMVSRLHDREKIMDELILKAQSVNARIASMKEYEEDINKLNELAKHKPRSTMILGLVQESRQIRQLQHDNQELKQHLEEHQSALELIMAKYREQVAQLLVCNKLYQQAENQARGSPGHSEELYHYSEKICEMAAVMNRACQVDDRAAHQTQERLSQLEFENRELRQLLNSSSQLLHQRPPRTEQQPHQQEQSSSPASASSSTTTVVHQPSSPTVIGSANSSRSITPTPCSNPVAALTKSLIENHVNVSAGSPPRKDEFAL